MKDDNGVWVYDENQIADLIFNYMKNWLEDTLPENLLNVSTTIGDEYSFENFEKATLELYSHLMEKKIIKLTTIKENLEKNLQTNEK
jgi:hypothetical protein